MLQVGESAAAGQGGAAQPTSHAINMSADSATSKVGTLQSPATIVHILWQANCCPVYLTCCLRKA